ncbi:MAG: transcriptional regulator domain-containing protein [Alphaproteobacteria bacterium]
MQTERTAANALEWQSRAAYDYTLGLPRRAWAWEFLRRDPHYRSAWFRACADAAVERISSRITVIRPTPQHRELAHWGILCQRSTA